MRVARRGWPAAGHVAAEDDGPWMEDLPEGVELPVPAVLRKYFTHFIVKYHTTTTVRYFRPNGTYIDVDCAIGVHQGCPFGTTLFCAALHVSLSLVMARHPDVEAVAYADNIYLVAPLTKAHAAGVDIALLPEMWSVGYGAQWR